MNDFTELRLLGASIRADLPDAVDTGARGGWSVQHIQPITGDMRKYFRLASRLAFRRGALALCLAVVAITALVAGGRWTLICTVFFGAVALVAVSVAYRLSDLLFILPSLQKLPNAIYRDLIGPLWINLDALNIAVSAALGFFLFRTFSLSTSLPFLCLIAALWLFSPWALYLLKNNLLFAWVRVVQFIVLVAAALFTAASPVPMEHFQWNARRATADRLRPVAQKEVTANWPTLIWFTQEGAPNVWYSSTPAGGFRLFSAPGHDPDTNDELIAVTDGITKQKIVADFIARRDAIAQKAAVEKAVQVEAEREKLIREFVSVGALPRPSTRRVVALIVAGQISEDTEFGHRVSEVLDQNGVRNDPSIFRSAFGQSSVLQDMLASRASAPPFPVENFASHLLVVQVKNTVRPQQAVNGVDMKSVDSTCTITLVTTVGTETLYSTNVAAHGVGFNESDATKTALDHLVKVIAQEAPRLSNRIARIN